MTTRKHTSSLILLLISILFLVSCGKGSATSLTSPDQPEATKEELFNGITYQRVIKNDPHPMVIHIVTIDLKADGIKPLVTPPDNAGSDKPLNARTTTEFLEDFNVQLAINGDAFQAGAVLDLFSYPASGDGVDPIGFAASNGTTYSQDTDEENTLYIYKSNKASINHEIGKIFQAVSGSKLLVWNGEAVVNKDDGKNPRTAVGTNRAGNKLIIIIVDGRQPGYSEGATLLEMSGLMLVYKMHNAINLDGGGSSTLVIEGPDGKPLVLNSPIHSGIPGNERPVANHLGFKAKD